MSIASRLRRCTGQALLAAVIAIVTQGAAAAAADNAGTAPSATGRFTPAQFAEVQRRSELAKVIIARLAPEARQLGLSHGWQLATLNILLGNTVTRLAEIAKLGDYRSIIAAATRGNGSPVQKALGDSSKDLVYEPFTPCRYIDTRNVGGKINGIVTYDLANNGGTYGGGASCDPRTLAGVANEDTIAALSLNVTIVDTSSGAPGFLAVRPAGSTNLTSLVNWYVASASAQDANSTIATLNQAGPNELEILTSGPVHAIVDLLGAFLAPSATALDCITVQSNNGNVDQAPGTSAEFSVTCTTGYQVTGGGCHFFNTDGTPATENTVVLNRTTRARDPNTGTFLNAWACQLTNNDPVKSFRFGARAVCCRTPGR